MISMEDYEEQRIKEIKHKLVINAIANPLRLLSREDLELYTYYLEAQVNNLERELEVVRQDAN
jgi:hypothetical protein